jgi:hypothetical protein
LVVSSLSDNKNNYESVIYLYENNIEPKNPAQFDDLTKVKLKKLFKEVVDDWLLKTNYLYEVSSIDPQKSEQRALEKYRIWTRRLADIIEDEAV